MVTESTTAKSDGETWWRHLEPAAPITLICVALAGTYAASVLNILPSFVSAWVAHLRISDEAAGDIATVNLLSHAAGVCATLFLVTRWPLPRIVYTGLALGVLGDLASTVVVGPWQLGAVRALSGIGLGLQYGAVINWLGRSSASARGFGIFLLLQFVFAAVFFVGLPSVEELLGHISLYVMSLGLALMAAPLAMVLSLNGGSRPLPPHTLPPGQTRAAGVGQAATLPKIFAVFSFAAFNIAAMGLWGFMQLYGESTGLSAEDSSRTLALCSLAGIPGAFVAISLETQFGRLLPLLVALGVIAVPIATFAFVVSTPAIFIAGQLVIGFAWTVIIPYFFAILSALDNSGRLGILGMVVAAVAAAFGPAAVGLAVGQGTYRNAFIAALVAFAASALCTVYPARVADRRQPKG